MSAATLRLTWLDITCAIVIPDNQAFKREHEHTEEGTHVDHPGGVASAQVVQHRRLVEVRQHGHVFNHVILGRIHLLDVPFLHCQSLLVMGAGRRERDCAIRSLLHAKK